MGHYFFDVTIIGPGIAGLTAAIKLAEAGFSVGIISREKDPFVANTNYAQGGIIFPSEDDLLLKDDIMRASSKTSNLEAIDVITRRSGKILKEILLDKVQTDFTRDEQGNLAFTKEAAHSKARIIFKGDYTGKSIHESLLNALKDKTRFPTVSFLHAHTAIDLLTPGHHGISIKQRYEQDQVVGVYVLNQETGAVIKVLSKATILATGGVGSLYLHHTNAEGARGDGHAMAGRAGAKISNMEFIQFHPTTLFGTSGGRRFLISEAVRGEGGILVNSNGEAFMEKYHVDKELAPRDIVARAIVEETIKTAHGCVYLDISHKDGDWLKNRFPTIYKHCLENNIDITKTAIPVVPAAHYSCGGVKTDMKGRTSLKNLYAVGEVACTGLHGANRLASTALLEGLTWGYLAAEDIISESLNRSLYSADKIKDWESLGNAECDLALIQQDWLTLRQTMWNYVGLIRTADRLIRAQAMFRELNDEIKKFYKNATLHDALIGLRNAVDVGFLVVNASMINKESVGCFYRKN